MKTQNEVKHTPTPLMTPCNCGELDNLHIRHYGIKHYSIVGCVPMTPAYYAAIVRAVNSHAALLEAAKMAVNNLSEWGNLLKGSDGRMIVSTLREAIAQSEEK